MPFQMPFQIAVKLFERAFGRACPSTFYHTKGQFERALKGIVQKLEDSQKGLLGREMYLKMKKKRNVSV